MKKRNLVLMVIYSILTAIFIFIVIGVLFITIVDIGWVISDSGYSTFYIVGAIIGQIFKIIGLFWCLFYFYDHARKYRKQLYPKGRIPV